MLKSQQFKIFVSLLFVLLLTTYCIVYVLSAKREESVSTSVDVMGESDTSGIPYITNLAPTSVSEGEEYIFVPKLIDADSNIGELVLELVEAPFWLNLSDSVLRGIPPMGNTGVFKVVLRVSDGNNSSSQEIYILVIEKDE